MSLVMVLREIDIGRLTFREIVQLDSQFPLDASIFSIINAS